MNVTLLSPDFFTNQQFTLRELLPFKKKLYLLEIHLLFCHQQKSSGQNYPSRSPGGGDDPARHRVAAGGGGGHPLPRVLRVPSLSLSGLVISEKPWKAEDDVGKQLLIVKNNVVLELLDISVLRVGNLPPCPSGGALKGLMLYSIGAEL